MAILKLKVLASYGQYKAEREQNFEVKNFKDAEAGPLAYGKIMPGEVVLEVLAMAGIQPEHPQGGEDYDLGRGEFVDVQPEPGPQEPQE